MVDDGVATTNPPLFFRKPVLYWCRNSLLRMGAVTAVADPAGPHTPLKIQIGRALVR